MNFMDSAMDRFAPLITTLMMHLPATLIYDVENTGGGTMCLFVRRAALDRQGGADLCVVFPDEWDEPDPTADAVANCAAYIDWNDPDDLGVAYWSIIRYEHGREGLIAEWAATIIRGWVV